MPRPKEPEAPRPERLILLVAGESGAGKSFFVANLKNALIFDTDLGGGLSYAEERIRRNGSERVEVGSYTDVIEEIHRRGQRMAGITTLAIDHLTTLQQEAVLRHNPTFEENTFGREHDRANKEWRKIRELARMRDFNLVCTAHMKAKYENKKQVGFVVDGSKNVEGDFHIVLYLKKGGPPSQALVHKWRRDPEDARGKPPGGFAFTMEKFLEIHGHPLGGERQEVEMASPAQVAQLEQLLGVVKVPEDWLARVLAKAKAESPEDLTAEAMGKCLNYLNGLIGGKPKVSEENAA